jgi:hypothetical protein
MKSTLRTSVPAWAAFVLLGLLAASCGRKDKAARAPDWNFPSGPVTVDVMDLAGTPRLQHLHSFVMAAARRDPEWFTTHVRSAPQGGPLPYDSKLGLTEAEYSEYLELLTSMKLMKKDSAEVTFKPVGERRIMIVSDSKLPGLNGITIDFANNRVGTPFGQLTEMTRIGASEEQQASGPWSGYQWKLPNGENAQFVRFSLGRLLADGRTIISYDAEVFGERKRVSETIEF